MLERVTYYCYIHVRVTSPVPQKATGKHFAGPRIFIKLPYPPYSHFFNIIVSKHEYSFKKSITLLQKKNSWIIFFKDKQHSTPKKAKNDCICNIEICLYQDVWTHDCCILMRQGEKFTIKGETQPTARHGIGQSASFNNKEYRWHCVMLCPGRQLSKAQRGRKVWILPCWRGGDTQGQLSLVYPGTFANMTAKCD